MFLGFTEERRQLLRALNKHFSGSHLKILTSFPYLFNSKHSLSLCGRNYTDF